MAIPPPSGQPAAGPAIANPPASAVIRVSDAAGLTAALKAATGGETILLADGDYGAMTLSNRFAQTVTLQSETPQGARFTALTVQSAAQMTFDGLLLDYVATPGSPASANSRFDITASSGITFRNSLFDGDVMDCPGDPADGYPVGRGLMVTQSDGILIENNEFRSFWKGLNLGNTTNAVVRGNEIHDMRSDGINLSAVDGVVVEGNYIHDFNRNLATGDHPDMIQMWSSGNSLVPRNVTIRDNYLDMGGGSTTQSIFLSHNAAAYQVHGGSLAFENITVTGNVIVNGHDHGITLGTTRGAVVANNTVLAPPGSGLSAPRISIDGLSTGVVLTDNIAERIQYVSSPPAGWTVSGNVLAQSDAPGQPNYYGDLFVNAMSGITGTPENLRMLPDSPAALAGAGAAQLRGPFTPAALTALARAESGGETGGLANEIRFDAGYSAGPAGPAAGLGAKFHWDFGDGTSGTGETVLHRYTQPGVFTAVLTVTLPDGSQDTSAIRSVIHGPDLLSFSGGALQFYDTGLVTDIDPGAAAAAGDGRLHFAATTAIALPKGSEAALEDAAGFSIALRLQADAPGTLMALKTAFGLQITSTGEISASMPSLTGNLVTAGAHLLDGALHDVVIGFDGAARMLTLIVDGAVLASIDPGIAALPGILDGNVLKLGATNTANGFSGTVEMLEIDVNPALYDMTPLPVPAAAPAPPVLSGQLEIGTVTVGQNGGEQWHSVTFSAAIPDARVVMGPLDSVGKHAAVMRVRNVTDSGFEFQIDEWDYLDGKHVAETVSWLAASAGDHMLASGQRIVVGRSLAADEALSRVALSHFDGGTVLAQVSSAAGREAVTTRISGVASDGFDLHLQEQEAADGLHAAETVDWIALEEHADGFAFVSLQLAQDWQTIAPPAPGLALLGGMQTEVETDTAALRYRLDAAGTISLQIQEEQSADKEILHRAEETHLLFADAGLYDLFA